jgi:hypothetical protein
VLHLFAVEYGWSKSDMEQCTVEEANYLVREISKDREAQRRVNR